MPTKIPMTHPGATLREEYFAPLGVTQIAAAKATGIPQSRLSEIFAGRRAITADTAARLGRFFKVDPRKLAQPPERLRSVASRARPIPVSRSHPTSRVGCLSSLSQSRHHRSLAPARLMELIASSLTTVEVTLK